MNFPWRASSLLAVGALSLTLTACAVDGTETSDASRVEPLSVFATTGYIADAVSNIAPSVEIITMVGPGGDPHTYQPTTRDIEDMNDADLVLWNGLHLEAQMQDQLMSFGDKQTAVAETVAPDLLLSGDGTLYDPHIWNSPEAWQQVVDTIAAKLGEIDPENSKQYANNADAYNEEISETYADVSANMSAVPEPRILVTGHDAFAYFGETFNLEVRATDFISTEAALSASELSELADYIADNEVPVIFQDNQANPQAITALKEAVESRGWTVEISTEELFADSLGPTEPVDTYLGALRHNADTVLGGLS
ncbi:metal ABC transporter substrate-binding protein [Corynebacterium sp. S7]